METERAYTAQGRAGDPGDPCAMVILGAGGDLTKRKLIPALYNLAKDNLLSREFALVGFGRADLTHEQFRQKCSEDVKQFATGHVDPDLWHWFLRRMYYVRGDFNDAAAFQTLKQLLDDVRQDRQREEEHACQVSKVEYIELPVAFDSLSLVVNRSNSFASCLTVGELKHLWEPAAERKVTRWNQLRSNFPVQPVALFGPGASSGTFDYFTLAIVGTESSSRKDYTASEDDEVLAKGVADDPNAMAYFGYAYYREHQDTLKLVAVDNGKGCVTPSAETVADNTYQPLSRPIFIYVNKESAGRPAVHALARSYVDPENAKYVQEVGYLPLPTATLLATRRRLDSGTTGSIFGGQGSVLGLTAASFEDEDRIKSALVR